MTAVSITAASVAKTSSTQSVNGVAGETITAGQPVYLKAADGRLWKALNTTLAASQIVGIALHGSLAGQPLAYAVPGYNLTIGATLVLGSWYFVGGTAGTIVPAGDIATGAFAQCLGYADSTTTLFQILGGNPGVAYAGAGAFAA